MKFLRVPQRLASYWKNYKTTARAPQHNDVYIVEFPKSGVTWLSTILANVALIESGRKEVASFAAVHLFVPDIHQTRDIGPVPYDRPPVRMIKSHAEFNPNYPAVIYLARKPLDVMKSYFRFNHESGGPAFESFDSFCRSNEFGIPCWRRHVRSWLTGSVIGQRLHVCRYEDLFEDAFREIDSISKNFGWNISREAISEALRRSSMDQMRAAEDLYRTKNPRYTMRFVGGSNDFEIEASTVAYIEQQCRVELKLLGYV